MGFVRGTSDVHMCEYFTAREIPQLLLDIPGRPLLMEQERAGGDPLEQWSDFCPNQAETQAAILCPLILQKASRGIPYDTKDEMKVFIMERLPVKAVKESS
mmetsp:Transcript_9307/g.15469  ORF Transcript_9307/g.15469 Transcript_9307/m.15469 type:complete len:101 (-) Transcript_9307:35-337(-)